MNDSTHNRLALILIGGARGDLEFSADGNIRYSVPLNEKKGPLLLKLHRAEPRGYRWEVTPAGADFLLENLQDCYTESERRQLETLTGRR